MPFDPLGFGEMRDMGNSGGWPANRTSSPISFSPGPSSRSFMPSIPEIITHTPEQGGNTASGKEFEAAFTCGFWHEDPHLNSLRQNWDGEVKMFFNGLDNQNGETTRSKPMDLGQHSSLPKTSTEMGGVYNYLQFQQDNIPCQIRAKRGCATHPRSIAERVRRMRISQKLKKLQDLFPDMDRQSTADMLDFAVEHIKDLQKQVQTLSKTRSKCVCLSKPHETIFST